MTGVARTQVILQFSFKNKQRLTEQSKFLALALFSVNFMQNTLAV